MTIVCSGCKHHSNPGGAAYLLMRYIYACVKVLLLPHIHAGVLSCICVFLLTVVPNVLFSYSHGFLAEGYTSRSDLRQES